MRSWETSPNVAKLFDEQFGKMYDANLAKCTMLIWQNVRC